MRYRVVWWKNGERIDGKALEDREATLHAALHLHAGEKADETRVYEETLYPAFGLFRGGMDKRLILRVWR